MNKKKIIYHSQELLIIYNKHVLIDYMNVRMIKNNYGNKTIRKISYIPREKKMRINTTIIDTTMTLRATISIIEIEIRKFDNSICSIV